MSDHEHSQSGSDVENVEPIGSANGNVSLVSNNSLTERKVGLPPEFFEYMANMGESTNQKGSLYKCLFKGCKQKTNKDGTPKYLKIKNDSRGNGKRHYLAHDPNNERKHAEKWKLAIGKMTSKENIEVIHRAPTTQHILKQSDFDNYVLVKNIYTTTFLNTSVFTLQHFCIIVL